MTTLGFFKWKLSSGVSAAFIYTPQDATLLEMEQKKRGSFWTFTVTVDAVAMAAAPTALVTLPHHGTVTIGITLLQFPHEADISVSTAARRHGWSMASEAASSAQQEGNKYISQSQQPPHPFTPIPSIVPIHVWN